MLYLKSLAFILLMMAASVGSAGVWDEPENLKVLPEDIAPMDLRATMHAMKDGLGMRCGGCHYSEEVDGETRFDFARDESDNKEIAREMMKLVNQINGFLGKTIENAEPVTCATCHRGASEPKFIEDIVANSYNTHGMDAALAQYRALRDDYYGGYVFDFSPQPLNKLAENLAAKYQDYEAALRLLEVNAEFNPESVRTYQIQGDILKAAGNVEEARSSYKKALEIDPDNDWTKTLLDKLPPVAEAP